ncbi:MAG: major facilitator superfamily 1, partial [Ilumatobacteraceae bacterium]|nr:major facilitator superfamily 1 [Ilumatobacteraceae bacterium]
LPALQDRAHISTSQLGLIATAGFVAALVAQIVIAPHADRGRERLVINGAIITMALSTLMYAFGDSIAWFIAGRIGAGLAYGAFTPAAIGLIVRHFPEGQGRRIGRLQSLELAGMAIGPLLAVIGKVSIGVVPTLMVAAVLTLVVGSPALLTRLSVAPAAHWGEAEPAHASFFSGFGLLRHRSVMAAACIIAAFYIPMGAYDALFPRFLTDIGSSDWTLGLALTAFAVPSVFLASWAGRQVDKLGPFRAAARGGVANIAVVLSYGVVRIPMVIVVIGLFESGGQTLIGAAGAAAMGWAVPGRRAATAQGLGEATGTIAAALVAFVAAPLYAFGGPTALFFTTAALTAGALYTGVRLSHEAVPAERRTAPLVTTNTGRIPVTV